MQTLTAGRNLYKIWQGENVVALITAATMDTASNLYYKNGGKKVNIRVERITFGYPENICIIYR